jgi:ribosomal protein S14
MKFIKTRDISNRGLFKSYEVESKVFKFLQVRLLNDPLYFSNKDRGAILKYLLLKRRSCKKSKILFRCVLTNRSRGNLRKLNVSRIVLKKAVGLGLLPGYSKSVW